LAELQKLVDSDWQDEDRISVVVNTGLPVKSKTSQELPKLPLENHRWPIIAALAALIAAVIQYLAR
jgi:hypothetical protein